MNSHTPILNPNVLSEQHIAPAIIEANDSHESLAIRSHQRATIQINSPSNASAISSNPMSRGMRNQNVYNTIQGQSKIKGRNNNLDRPMTMTTALTDNQPAKAQTTLGFINPPQIKTTLKG